MTDDRPPQFCHPWLPPTCRPDEPWADPWPEQSLTPDYVPGGRVALSLAVVLMVVACGLLWWAVVC